MTARIGGFVVNKVQVDEALSIQDEFSVVLTFDRATRFPTLLLYTGTSISIENAANAVFESMSKISIDPLIGLQRYQIRALARQAGFPDAHLAVFIKVCLQMWSLFTDLDARYVAFSPLVITETQRVVALDGKIALDQNAGFRQTFIFDHSDMIRRSDRELEAYKLGFTYLDCDGKNAIACMANGAGLALSTMDMIAFSLPIIRSPWLRVCDTRLLALLTLAFAPAPDLPTLSLAAQRNSQVYSTKDTPQRSRAVTSCRFAVSGSLSLPSPWISSAAPRRRRSPSRVCWPSWPARPASWAPGP